MSGTAGIRALAVSFPRTVRTNEHWRERYPEMVADAEQKTLARIWAGPSGPAASSDPFDAEMAPYLSDPFRGTVERRVLAPGETSLMLEAQAAREALAAAAMTPGDVDLMIVSSFLPDTIGVGNAAFLARELGLRGAAWNLETACTSSVVALQTACALVQSGQYRNVLVVVSCTYSRVAEETDSLSWFLGDGAGAFVVGPAAAGEGFMGARVIHTGVTCGTFYYDLVADPGAAPRVRMQATAATGRVLKETAVPFLRECAEGAAHAAGVSLRDIDFFAFNTPTAWYAAFCTRALGVDPSRTISTYPRYANIGPALMTANLFHAAREGRVRKGDLVMVYAVGSVSSAAAAVMRWGDVSLGREPE
jgi:3-oxoacyl-[acyl-carrier-protein] synthase-3